MTPAERTSAMPSEAKYAIASLALLIFVALIPGGRVLVLPALFVLVLVLLFWAAKPGSED
jgi:hypothetical protein